MDERRLKEKLSGRTRYPLNVSSKNMNYIRIIVSPVDLGILDSLDLPEFPENFGFLGPKDIPGANKVTMGGGEMPLFAHRDIRFKGEFLGVIYGPDLLKVNELLNQVRINYSPKPALPALCLSEVDSSGYHKEIRKGSPEELLEKSDFLVLEDYYEFSGIEYNDFTPPHSSCQREGNKLTVHVVTQWPWIIHKNISSILRIKKENIALKTYPCENNQDVFILAPLLSALISSLVSFHTRKTSTLIIHSQDVNLNSCHTGDTRIYLKGAVNKQGILQAIKLDFTQEAGAFGMMDQEIVERMCLAATGVYQCRDVEINGRTQITSRKPVIMGSDGAHHAINTALEMFVGQLALGVSMSPQEWKDKNLLQKNNCFFTGFSFVKDPKLNFLLKKTIEKSDFNRKYAAYQHQSSQREKSLYGRHRGIGLSMGFTGNGYISSNKELKGLQIKMRLEQDLSLHIYLPSSPGHSQLFRIWALSAAEVLNIEDKNVQFYINEDNLISVNGPSSMGRNVTLLNNLIQQCLVKISKRRFRDPLPIEDHSQYRKGRKKWDNENFEGMPYSNLSWGSLAVELEYHEESNDIQLLHCWGSVDSGLLLFPSLVDSVIEQGLKQCFQWLDYSINPSTQYPVTLEMYPSNNQQSKSLDGLIQSLFPAAFLQALSQAKGRNQHFIPIRFSEVQTQ